MWGSFAGRTIANIVAPILGLLQHSYLLPHGLQCLIASCNTPYAGTFGDPSAGDVPPEAASALHPDAVKREMQRIDDALRQHARQRAIAVLAGVPAAAAPSSSGVPVAAADARRPGSDAASHNAASDGAASAGNAVGTNAGASIASASAASPAKRAREDAGASDNGRKRITLLDLPPYPEFHPILFQRNRLRSLDRSRCKCCLNKRPLADNQNERQQPQNCSPDVRMT